jgi:hypothetical protein
MLLSQQRGTEKGNSKRNSCLLLLSEVRFLMLENDGVVVGLPFVSQNNIDRNTITIPARVGLHKLSPYLDR